MRNEPPAPGAPTLVVETDTATAAMSTASEVWDGSPERNMNITTHGVNDQEQSSIMKMLSLEEVVGSMSDGNKVNLPVPKKSGEVAEPQENVLPKHYETILNMISLCQDLRGDLRIKETYRQLMTEILQVAANSYDAEGADKILDALGGYQELDEGFATMFAKEIENAVKKLNDLVAREQSARMYRTAELRNSFAYNE